MPQFIMKLHDEKENKDYYLEWSTIVDAPITYGMELAEFKQFYLKEYGHSNYIELEERLKRANEKGISAHPPYDNLDEYFEFNRAGCNETTITKEQIIECFCRKRYNPKRTNHNP